MSDPNSSDSKFCDIVMKGGITSGVVYPRAITTLAKRYKFKNVGGTSAGAIAAAAAAAAEYRRTTRGEGNRGFDQIDKLPGFLGEKPDPAKRTRLFYLFQPDPSTWRLFQVLSSPLGSELKPIPSMVKAAMRNYAAWTCLGALPGLALAGLTAFHLAAGWIGWVWLLVSVLLYLAGAVLTPVIRFLIEVVMALPKNNYGLCSGMAHQPCPEGPALGEQPESLTVWLTRYLNETAGLGPQDAPLTFGQLWGTPGNDPEPEHRVVNLEMMTTNLTHGRPYRLPFRQDDDLNENHLFYFRKDEFLKLFPGHVVEWMVHHPRDAGHGEKRKARLERRKRLREKGYYPLPSPADMPVVVATRMSLSFPILLCAIPLHSIDWTTFDGNEQPERCWFSDGGMSSNFPLHLFDAALPRRPTFSFDLAEKPESTPKEELCPEMPERNSGKIANRWNRFDTAIPTEANQLPAEKPATERLLGFFGAIISSMQNWTDSTQGRLPGYRDRIVAVPLTPKEGGLNLEMPDGLIKELSDRGAQAAELIMKHFDHPPEDEKMTWDNHRWIRLRSYLASLEKSLDQLVLACENPENGDLSYKDWLSGLAGAHAKKAPSYLMNKQQLAAAQQTLAKLREIHALWAKSPAAHKAPRPRPILRPRPQV
jgi:hypothetical protein